jgi:hypothetical protein
MIIDLKKDVTGIRHDVRMSVVAGPESGGVERRAVIRGALQWR